MTRNLRSLALTVGFLTMACAEVAPAQTQATLVPEGCAQHQARFAGLLGKAPEEVRAALQAMPGITTVRMGGPNTPMTRDYRIAPPWPRRSPRQRQRNPAHKPKSAAWS